MSLRSLLLSSFYGPVSDVDYDFGGIIFHCLRIWVNVSGLFSATIRKIFWEGMMHLCVVLNTLMQQVRFCSAHIHLCPSKFSCSCFAGMWWFGDFRSFCVWWINKFLLQTLSNLKWTWIYIHSSIFKYIRLFNHRRVRLLLKNVTQGIIIIYLLYCSCFN